MPIMPISGVVKLEPPRSRIVSLLNRWEVQMFSLLAFALVFNREGDRVPTGNEWIYLLYVWKAWHPAFLAGDWTFQEPTAGHAIFNCVGGLPTLALRLSAVAWAGRVICWTLCFAALLRIARRFAIPPWARWVAILLWLVDRQSLVSTEWIIGTYEAKCFAWSALLFAIDFAIDRKLIRAGILTGLAFTFHTAVGLWAGAALGVAVMLNSPVRQTIVFSLLTIVFALPGLMTSIPLVFGPHAISPAEAKFLMTIALPACGDPAVWPPIWIAVMIGLIGFATAHAAWRWERRGIRMLFQFEAAAAVFFGFGLLARLLGRFDWLELYPIRVYAVLAMLLFFLQLADTLAAARPPAVLVAGGAAAFFFLPAPGVALWATVRSHVGRAREPAAASTQPVTDEDADFRACAAWVHDNTPATAVVICPPWRNDAFYLMERPLIADWHAPRYDRMTEWKARLESLVGPLSQESVTPDDDLGDSAKAYYEHLSAAEIAAVRGQYGGDYLISPAVYKDPIAARCGRWTVYRLR
jgi:hypothetical protein